MTTGTLGPLGEITAAMGAVFSDGQALLDTFTNQNVQWDVTQDPALWSQTASILGLVATSAQTVLDILNAQNTVLIKGS